MKKKINKKIKELWTLYYKINDDLQMLTTISLGTGCDIDTDFTMQKKNEVYAKIELLESLL